MGAINQLRTAINTILGENYYFDEAPDNAEYPYRIGQISGSVDEETPEILSFDIDYWDKGKSSALIYDLAETDAGNGDRNEPTGLNGARIQMENGYAKMYKENTTPVQDPDKGLRRIRVNYMIRLYYQ